MKVSRGRSDDAAVAGTEFAPHTGHVQLDIVLKADDLFVIDAYYAAGSRTYWHHHERGQLITVIAGKGVVVTRDGDVALIRKGDVVHCPPGEEHWHGAAPDCFVAYSSVSLGGTETLERVSDSGYDEVWA